MSSVSMRKLQQKAEIAARIVDLKSKIYDATYLDGAIQRIAQVMSSRLVDTYDYRENRYVRQ